MENILATIIPIHELNEKTTTLFNGLLNSVDKQKKPIEGIKHYIVCPKTLEKDINNITSGYTNLNITILINEGLLDFQSQVNFGVSNIEEKYFAILEYDDEVNDLTDVDLFLSTIIETDKDGNPQDFRNQHVWSKQYVGENGIMGYLNPDLLNQFSDFKICGAVFNKDKFLKIGGLKKNIKLSFQYELLLRLLNNGGKIYTVPKLGYKHVIMREGSLFDFYAKNMSLPERKFWFDTAQKEYHFNNDRDIKFDVKSK
jgi:hypothetical protein